MLGSPSHDEAFKGTPVPVKTPINFQQRKTQQELSNKQAQRKLCIVAFVSVFFIAAQMTGGILANSIAIFTDTAHLASDLVGFGISMISLLVAQKPATKILSFGFHRAEIIGTLVSVVVIQGLTVWLVYEATLRIIDPPVVNGPIMLITAVAGLFFNLIQMKILHSGDGHYHLGGEDHHHDHGHSHGHSHGKRDSHKELKQGLINDDNESHGHEEGHQHHDHGHDHEHEGKKGGITGNINVDSAFLHVLGDMLMSVGVIIAATFIYFEPTWTIADPLCTYLFSIIVITTTVPITKNCMTVLMEGTPALLDTD